MHIPLRVTESSENPAEKRILIEMLSSDVKAIAIAIGIAIANTTN